ncbi:MAG TPA: AAA family ATPase [Bacteroidia bacterium]|jgi:AAA15 family ATPase/GTPase|nr:AAA family ATPase [Bacteroidia bacterium]
MKIGIDNFRSFKGQEFGFSKVNILIGENSAGKSSLLKFILALKQTMNKGTNLKLHGEYVDLGNYQEVIYYHELSNKLRFSFNFEDECKNYNKSPFHLNHRKGILNSF